ncbi:MAG: S41 family peptidase, partial [Candidatus Saccharimonadaceae bacterium]|nr:S41 family peptidase [Candidatus Saccharimonadaceae bacterium]
LQDYDAAKIVGETTFGKGSVQELVNLTSGAELKVTVARWYTPKGNNINGSGIKPDHTIEMTQADVDNDDDPQLDKAKEVLGY